MYTTVWCPYCARARALLEKKGVAFTEIASTKSPARRGEMIQRAQAAAAGAADLHRWRAYRRQRRHGRARPRRQARRQAGDRDDEHAVHRRVHPVHRRPRSRAQSAAGRRAGSPGARCRRRFHHHPGGQQFYRERQAPARQGAARGRRPVSRRHARAGARIGAWLLLGSLVIDPAGEPGAEIGEERLANRSFLLDAAGAIVARYDKIHMFDIDLPGGESYRESNAYRPGGQTVVAETPWGRLGMSVCYDLRFPHLYRALAQAGADFLSVPVVFTVPTGKAHWHVLLRARAIENGCFCPCPGAMGRAHRRAQELWPLADRRSVGRGAGRWRRGGRDRHREDRPGADRRGAPLGAVIDTRPLLHAADAGSPLAGRRIGSSCIPYFYPLFSTRGG